MKPTREPETKHLSAEVLEAQLERLRTLELTSPGTSRAIFVAPITPHEVDDDAPTRLALRVRPRDALPAPSDAVTATAFDVAALRAVPSPRRGHKGVGSTTNETAPASSVDAAPVRDGGTGTAHFDAAEVRRELRNRRNLRRVMTWAALGALSVALLASALAFGVSAMGHRLSFEEPRVASGDDVTRAPAAQRTPSLAPDAANAPAAASEPAAPVLVTAQPRTRPEASTAVADTSDSPASTRAAVDLLVSGRTRAALDAYRALASAAGSAPVYEKIVELLTRELHECEEGGGDACAQ